MTEQTYELNLSHVIPGTIDDVFDAWLDVDAIKIWMCPAQGVTVPNPKIDATVGGKFDFTMNMDGNSLPHSGEYVVIDRPNTLQFTWRSLETNNLDTMVTINFAAISPSSTRIDLHHKLLPTEASQQNHGMGWQRILECLAKDQENQVAV